MKIRQTNKRNYHIAKYKDKCKFKSTQRINYNNKGVSRDVKFTKQLSIKTNFQKWTDTQEASG